jgi:hypothetical protein
MKLIGHTQTLLALVFFLFAGLAQAQHAKPLLTTDIPFEFVVGNKTLPAGTYLFARVDPSILVLRNGQGRVVDSIVTTPAQAANVSDNAKLEFVLDNNGRHVLAQVWPAGDRYGNELVSPESVTAMARKQSKETKVANARP